MPPPANIAIIAATSLFGAACVVLVLAFRRFVRRACCASCRGKERDVVQPSVGPLSPHLHKLFERHSTDAAGKHASHTPVLRWKQDVICVPMPARVAAAFSDKWIASADACKPTALPTALAAHRLLISETQAATRRGVIVRLPFEEALFAEVCASLAPGVLEPASARGGWWLELSDVPPARRLELWEACLGLRELCTAAADLFTRRSASSGEPMSASAATAARDGGGAPSAAAAVAADAGATATTAGACATPAASGSDGADTEAGAAAAAGGAATAAGGAAAPRVRYGACMDDAVRALLPAITHSVETSLRAACAVYGLVVTGDEVTQAGGAGGSASPPPPPTPSAQDDLIAWDVQRCKFVEFRAGARAALLSALLHAWAALHPHSQYRQNMSSMAAAVLHVACATCMPPPPRAGTPQRAAHVRYSWARLVTATARATAVFARIADVWLGSLCHADAPPPAATSPSPPRADAASCPCTPGWVSAAVFAAAEARRMNAFVQVLRYFDPALAVYMDDVGLEPELYAVPFLTTLFADNLSLTEVVSLWDSMLCCAPDGRLPLFLATAVIMQVRGPLLGTGAPPPYHHVQQQIMLRQMHSAAGTGSGAASGAALRPAGFHSMLALPSLHNLPPASRDTLRPGVAVGHWPSDMLHGLVVLSKLKEGGVNVRWMTALTLALELWSWAPSTLGQLDAWPLCLAPPSAAAASNASTGQLDLASCVPVPLLGAEALRDAVYYASALRRCGGEVRMAATQRRSGGKRASGSALPTPAVCLLLGTSMLEELSRPTRARAASDTSLESSAVGSVASAVRALVGSQRGYSLRRFRVPAFSPLHQPLLSQSPADVRAASLAANTLSRGVQPASLTAATNLYQEWREADVLPLIAVPDIVAAVLASRQTIASIVLPAIRAHVETAAHLRTRVTDADMHAIACAACGLLTRPCLETGVGHVLVDIRNVSAASHRMWAQDVITRLVAEMQLHVLEAVVMLTRAVTLAVAPHSVRHARLASAWRFSPPAMLLHQLRRYLLAIVNARIHISHLPLALASKPDKSAAGVGGAPSGTASSTSLLSREAGDAAAAVAAAAVAAAGGYNAAGAGSSIAGSEEAFAHGRPSAPSWTHMSVTSDGQLPADSARAASGEGGGGGALLSQPSQATLLSASAASILLAPTYVNALELLLEERGCSPDAWAHASGALSWQAIAQQLVTHTLKARKHTPPLQIMALISAPRQLIPFAPEELNQCPGMSAAFREPFATSLHRLLPISTACAGVPLSIFAHGADSRCVSLFRDVLVRAQVPFVSLLTYAEPPAQVSTEQVAVGVAQ